MSSRNERKRRAKARGKLLKRLQEKALQAVAERKDSERDYPTGTRFSPNPKTTLRFGTVTKAGQRRFFKATNDLPVFTPLRKDTKTGRGERKRRYI